MGRVHLYIYVRVCMYVKPEDIADREEGNHRLVFR